MTTATTDPAIDSAAVVSIHDRAEWDALVAGLHGQPFQAWAWGELKAAFGWLPVRLATPDRRAAAQLLIRPYRGLAVAYVPRGPIGHDPALIAELVRTARSRRAAFLRLEPNVLESDESASRLTADLRSAGFRASDRTLQPRSSIRLDLAAGEDALLAGFSKGHRADIRRAERDGVALRTEASDGDGPEILHRMLSATRERKEFGFHSAGYWRTLMRALGDAAHLQVAERDGEAIAASLVLAWGSHGIYLAAGSTRAGLEHRAAHLLQWHAIRWARERGALTWDLWGIADARGRHELAAAGGSATPAELDALEAAARRDPLDGVYRFKKGWGGQVVRTVPAFDRVFIAPAYWFWQWRRGEA
jgi:lipid II:glycine glycyltransferase (peptidoglycan interpeptide bridge formation enzyme)